MRRPLELTISIAVLAACGDADTMDGSGGSEDDAGDTAAASESAGESGDGGVPTGCDGEGIGPGDYDRSVMHDGENRRYKIHVPPSYDGSPTTVVVNFHGFGSDAGQQTFFSQMNDWADMDDYIVVYPQGLLNGDSSQSWNAGTCCADDESRDDVGFSLAMLDRMHSELCIDRSRVFSTGMSNGGFMTNLLACEADDVFAAFAPVAGALGIPVAECSPSRPIPIMVLHGTDDGVIPYSAGESTAEFWAETNGCGTTRSTSFQQGVATCETWDGCPDGGEVALCTFEGVAHCWPGQPFCPDGASTEDAHVNALMWEFFQEHALP
jgi:polyhydroxybutyrate depolymerase